MYCIKTYYQLCSNCNELNNISISVEYLCIQIGIYNINMCTCITFVLTELFHIIPWQSWCRMHKPPQKKTVGAVLDLSVTRTINGKFKATVDRSPNSAVETTIGPERKTITL